MSKNKFSIHQIASKLGQKLLILILATVIVFVICPVQLCICIPSLTLRALVQLIARIFRPDLTEVMSGPAVVMALESVYTRPKLVIVLHLICDGKLSVEQLRREFERRILNYRDEKGKSPYAHLRQRWTQFLGFLFWQWDKNFSLKHHIRMYDYTEPELTLPEVCTEESLKRVTGRLIAQPFKKGHSPWEVLLVPRYRSVQSCSDHTMENDQTVMVWRIHHALADGYSLRKLLLKWYDSQGGRTTKVVQPKSQKISRWRMYVETVVTCFRVPFFLASQACSGFDRSNAWRLGKKKHSRNYLTFCSDAVPVRSIKDIKNKHGVSYNAAVYTVTLGGIRRMMLEAGQEVPKRICCYVPLPLPNHPGGLAIHISGLCFTFSPQLQSPRERLQQVSKEFRTIENSPALATVMAPALNLWTTLPVWILRLAYNKGAVTLGMTSFPFADQELDVLGTAKMVDIIPALGHPPGKIGAVAVLVSLAGKQRIVLTVDEGIFYSYNIPQSFAAHINDEVNALLNDDGKFEDV